MHLCRGQSSKEVRQRLAGLLCFVNSKESQSRLKNANNRIASGCTTQLTCPVYFLSLWQNLNVVMISASINSNNKKILLYMSSFSSLFIISNSMQFFSPNRQTLTALRPSATFKAIKQTFVMIFYIACR